MCTTWKALIFSGLISDLWGWTRMNWRKCFMREAMVFLDEGYFFGKEGTGFERINLACPSSVLEDALNRITQALKKGSE